jgi:D-amino-acid dehydrogenase
MRAIIIGAGLLGLTTAYHLRRVGWDVDIVEQRDGPGLAASFANAGLITPSMSEPWNSPGAWLTLLSSLGRSDSALQLRLKALPSLGAWGLAFLRHCNVERFRANTIANLRLALYAARALGDIQRAAAIAYDQSNRGSIRIFRTESDYDAALAHARHLAEYGLRHTPMTPAETTAREPALEAIAHHVAGALHYPDDCCGDALTFAAGLANHLQSQGVRIHYRCTVTDLDIIQDRVRVLRAGAFTLTGDHFVLAAGAESTALAARLGVRAQVRPVKGYSLTYASHPSAPIPCHPIIDDRLHAALTPLGGRLRVAGTAEFAGFDVSLPRARTDNLHRLVKQVLPDSNLDAADAKAWCGLRPTSCDGVPLIGATRIRNLWLNTGHGHLGWTMAAGAGAVLADLLNERAPAIDPTPYSPLRFDAPVRTLVQ